LVPLVAAAATSSGLTAYDPQFGTGYLPGRGTLGNLPAPAKAVAGSPSRQEVRELVGTALTALMQAHGFE
jgi:hypothetical protein